MRLFRRPAPEPLPLGRPTPDGGGWPPRTGRSFASSSLHELGVRGAFEVEAHAVADALVERVLPAPPPGPDGPHLAKLLLTAARVGAGLALAARSQPDVGEDAVDAVTAAALWEARDGLPAGAPLAPYALLAGFWVARRGPTAVDDLAGGTPGA